MRAAKAVPGSQTGRSIRDWVDSDFVTKFLKLRAVEDGRTPAFDHVRHQWVPKFAAELKRLGVDKWRSSGLIRYRDCELLAYPRVADPELMDSDFDPFDAMPDAA
jgi:hypothetical protein